MLLSHRVFEQVFGSAHVCVLYISLTGPVWHVLSVNVCFYSLHSLHRPDNSPADEHVCECTRQYKPPQTHRCVCACKQQPQQHELCQKPNLFSHPPGAGEMWDLGCCCHFCVPFSQTTEIQRRNLRKQRRPLLVHLQKKVFNEKSYTTGQTHLP